MNSVLAVYLTRTVAEGGLGFAEQSVGFLQSIVYAMTYVLPILGGALADRYGYRRMLHGGVLAAGRRLLRRRATPRPTGWSSSRCW